MGIYLGWRGTFKGCVGILLAVEIRKKERKREERLRESYSYL